MTYSAIKYNYNTLFNYVPSISSGSYNPSSLCPSSSSLCPSSSWRMTSSPQSRQMLCSEGLSEGQKSLQRNFVISLSTNLTIIQKFTGIHFKFYINKKKKITLKYKKTLESMLIFLFYFF